VCEWFCILISRLSSVVIVIKKRVCLTIYFASVIVMFAYHAFPPPSKLQLAFVVVLLTVHLGIFILVINQLDAQNFCFTISLLYACTCFSTCAHHQEVKIVLYSLWYHHTYRWPFHAQVERGEGGLLSQPVHGTATYKCDDTRGCIIQFWPLDDEHVCLKHVEAWNKPIVKEEFCASSWLITKTNPTDMFSKRNVKEVVY